MAKKYSTSFQEKWMGPEKYPQFASWIRRDPASKCLAKCVLCRNSFSVAGGGKAQVDSHAKGEGHKRAVQNSLGQLQVTDLFQHRRSDSTANAFESSSSSAAMVVDVETEPSTLPLPSTSSRCSLPSPSPSNPYVIREQTVRAEIIVAMNCSEKRQSYNSYRDFVEILTAMAPDSEVLKSMQLGSTKVAYMIAYGLAPYFKEKLISEISSSPVMVVCSKPPKLLLKNLINLIKI